MADCSISASERAGADGRRAGCGNLQHQGACWLTRYGSSAASVEAGEGPAGRAPVSRWAARRFRVAAPAMAPAACITCTDLHKSLRAVEPGCLKLLTQETRPRRHRDCG